MRHKLPFLLLASVGLLLLGLPCSGDLFYTRFAMRMMIYAMAAVSLDVLLGYGGMVSFGHAAFLGAGAYGIAILATHGITSVVLAWPVSIIATALCALGIGAVSLRTSGASFIMITLAFAQMLYYCLVSLPAYGGDDGLAVPRNTLPGFVDLQHLQTLYYIVLGILVLVLWGTWHLVRSPFGLVIQGIRANERRMQALGYATRRYKLAAFVLAGAIAGLAGVLLANTTGYISPSLLHWTRSGELLVMVILGGMGTLFGPLLGAAFLLLAEEILASYTAHWMIVLGPLLVLMVLTARGGMYGALLRWSQSACLARQSARRTIGKRSG